MVKMLCRIGAFALACLVVCVSSRSVSQYIEVDTSGFRYHIDYIPEDCRKRTNDGDFLMKHYTVWLGNKDGDKVDSRCLPKKPGSETRSPWWFCSYDRGHTFDFHLGLGEVIKGMDMGTRGMCKGEKRSITIPPQLAYGDQQRNAIPPSSTLYFEIELMDFIPSGYTQSVTQFAKDCKRRTKAGDEIAEHYNGTFLDGTPFDNSYSRNKPYEFRLGNREVIRGVDIGLMNMCVGERRRLVIPPILAYGDRGYDDVIPPNSTLVFDVELVEIVGGTFKTEKIDGPKCDRKAKKGDKVFIHHHTFIDGVRSATSSYTDDTPLEFVIGDGTVIEGLNMGVTGMCITERRRLHIPPELAHQTEHGKIPALTYLTMDVELIDFEAPDLFKLCDTNKDRWVSKKEFVAFMATTEEFEGKEDSDIDSVLEERFDELDVSQDDHLCRHEFYKIPHHHRDEL